MLTELTQDSR